MPKLVIDRNNLLGYKKNPKLSSLASLVFPVSYQSNNFLNIQQDKKFMNIYLHSTAEVQILAVLHHIIHVACILPVRNVLMFVLLYREDDNLYVDRRVLSIILLPVWIDEGK